MRSHKTKTLQMVRTALLSGILCVLAPIALPVPGSPVPLSLATFAVYLTGMLLGAKQGVLSVLVYLFLGMVGLPVFSGFSGGIGILLGPTGGYLLGYIPCVLMVGLWKDKKRNVTKLNANLTNENKKRVKCVAWDMLAMLSGTVLCYAFGTLWFVAVMDGGYTLVQALIVCVVPYFVFDAVKIMAAAALSLPLHRILRNRETSAVYEDFL